jgi:hypothetical protein
VTLPAPAARRPVRGGGEVHVAESAASADGRFGFSRASERVYDSDPPEDDFDDHDDHDDHDDLNAFYTRASRSFLPLVPPAPRGCEVVSPGCACRETS